MAVTMGPLVVHELAALLDTVSVPSGGAVAALGGDGLFNSELAELGHAALGLKYLAIDTEDRENFVSEVDQLRAAAARLLSEGRTVCRIGIVDGEDLTTIVVCGGGELTIMPVPDGWFLVVLDQEPDAFAAYAALEPALTPTSTVVAQQWDGDVVSTVVCTSGRRLAEYDEEWTSRPVESWSAFLSGLVDWGWA